MKINLLRKKVSGIGVLLTALWLQCFFAGSLLADTNYLQRDDELFAPQQSTIITGQVVSMENNEGLPGVNIVVKNTSDGTITDLNGEYRIEVPSPETVLVFSSVGFVTEEIVVGARTRIDIAMNPDIKALEEIVVVGYGIQEKMNLTGSVATVQSKEIVKVPTANVSGVLTGKAPGLLTKQSAGVPGADYTTLSIRGFEEPLVLVDGIETSWTRLDPNEIESISVLKDASAAVYGSRAGNGVVLITTKRGTTDRAVVTYNGSYTVQNPTTIPEFVSSWKYAEMLREGELNSGMPLTYTEEDVQKFKDGSDPDYVNENWYDATFIDWAPMQSHNLAVRGGTEKVKYYMTAGFLDQSSIYRSGDLSFKRYNIRSNVDVQVTDRLSASFDLSYRNELRYAPETSLDNIWINLKTALPVYRATLPDPTIGGAYSGFLERSPYAQTIRKMTGFNDDSQRYLTGKISVNYKIPAIKGLEAQAGLNYATTNTHIKIQDRPFDIYSYDYENDQYATHGSNGANSLTETFTEFTQLYPLVSLTYDNTFGNHHLKGLLLAEGIDTDRSFLRTGKVDLLSLDMPYMYVGSGENVTADGRDTETGRVSSVGRLNYIYNEKYLFEGTFRLDASHKFPKHSRWGFFPSVSAGWRLSEEPFIKDNLSWIDDIKLRASYSQTGQDTNVGSFSHITGYEILPGKDQVYVFGTNVYRMIRTTGLANPDVTWYSMNNYNVGIDASFMRGLIGFEFDVFHRIVDGLFAEPLDQYPSTFGAELPLLNINSTEDRGFDLLLKHKRQIGRDFNYSITGTLTYAREKYRRWAESPYTDPDQIRIDQREGNYTNRWIGYKSDGIFMSQEEIDNHYINQDEQGNVSLKPGDIRYVDLNNDSIINWRDQDVIGYGEFPDLTYGLDMQVQYKGFSLSALFQGASMFNSMISDVLRGPLQNLSVPFEYQYKYRWQPDPENPGVNINPDARLPRVLGEGVGTNTNNNKASDFWLQDATYLRLKNLNISYTLPSSLSGRSNINVYIAGSNLVTFSKLGIYKKSVDPEATQYQKFYPPVKTVSLGVNVTL